MQRTWNFVAPQPTSSTAGGSEAQLATRGRCGRIVVDHDATIHGRQQGSLGRPRGGAGAVDRLRLLGGVAAHHWQVHEVVLEVSKPTTSRC